MRRTVTVRECLSMTCSTSGQYDSASTLSPGHSAAAGDRFAAGGAADGEDAAAQANTKAAGSEGGKQENGEEQAWQQRKGKLQSCSFFTVAGLWCL